MLRLKEYFMTLDITLYQQFIRLPSLDNHKTGNEETIDFIVNFLGNIGFNIRIEASEKTDQPTIVAHYAGQESKNKIVFYGHYDIAPVQSFEEWISDDPFELMQIDDRLYGRGIADNKGPLLARMIAIKSLINSNKSVPKILWLIQGEEEISEGSRVAEVIFKTEIAKFNSRVFIEETGFNNIDQGKQISFLWSPSKTESELVPWKKLLSSTLNTPIIEYRHLNKLNAATTCPLLTNLPDDAIYIGFGPNDRFHQIHRENESLNAEKLLIHQQQFSEFITAYAEYNNYE